MKVISYSLFGFNKERQENCFVFADYLRGLNLNIRLARVLYPDYVVRLHTDKSTYDGLKHILERLPIQVVQCEDAELTKAMLWRMKPLFDSKVKIVLCRDLDSPLTYRERQAVRYWENREKVAHAMTDSISHDVAMMGGMIGFKTQYFKDYTGFDTWEQMVENRGIDYRRKGADQDLLNKYVYPCFAKYGSDSITQHYILGHGNTFLSDYHNTIPNMDIESPIEFKCTNDLCGHIGAAGYYTSPMLSFILKYKDLFVDLWEIEKEYKDIYYWTNENI
jgi:hypothetical protein